MDELSDDQIKTDLAAVRERMVAALGDDEEAVAVLNRDVRVATGENGGIVVVSAWCSKCADHVMPSRDGVCLFCRSVVADEDTLPAKEMLAQIAERARSGREPQADDAGGDGGRPPSERAASAPGKAVVGAPEPSRPDGLDLLERMDRGEPVAPTNGDVRVEAGEDGAAVVVSEFVGAGAPDPPPARRAGSRQKWTRERVLEAIAEVGGPLGRAPTQNEMIGAGYSSAFQACFASGALGKVEGRAVWADLVTEAGFEPRRRAKLARSEREPQADDGAHSRRGSVSGSASTLGKSAPAPSRSDTHPLKVPGTGLAYQSVEAARSAADEIEADGERVAEQARADGDLGRADLAVDRARELARKIREAAGIRSVDDELAMQEVHEAGAGGPQERHVPGAAGMQETHKRRGGRRPTWTEEAALAKLHDQAVDGVAPARAAFLASGISSAVIVRLFGSYTAMVERAGLTPMLVARHEGRVPDPPIHVLVRPEEMAPFQRSIALATIAGLRAAADVLEAELGAGQAE